MRSGASSLEMHTKQKNWAKVFFQETRRNFSSLIMLGAFCTRLAPIFDMPEVGLYYVFNAFGRAVSGNAHICTKLKKLRQSFFKKRKRDAISAL